MLEYLSDLAADASGQTFTIGPPTGLAPPAPGRLPSETYQAMEDRRMWTLDASWASTAVFSDQTSCVRISDFGTGYRTTKPYVNPTEANGCRNWAGSHVPPSCSWAVWRVAGCDSATLLNSLFQLPRYLWAQKKMLGMLANKPTLAQFGPALADAQASWVNDALALVSALVYSTNIRFDDDGAYNWGDRGRDTYAASLVTEGLLLWPSSIIAGSRPPREPGSAAVVRPRFYNNMSTRPGLIARASDPNLARQVPLSKVDFEPVVWLPRAPSTAHWESAVNTLNTSGSSLERLKGLARYFPTDFAAALAEAERQIRHYSSVPFFRWQQVALERWVLAMQSIVQLIPVSDRESMQRLRNDLNTAARNLSTMPEASLRAATAEEASRVGNSPYAALINTVISLINSTAGLIMAVIQPLLDALARALIEAAGAATGRPALCPSLPYLRIFDRADCTVDIEAELRRLEARPSPGPGSGPGPTPGPMACPAGTTGTWPRCTRPPTKSSATPLFVGAAALLLLSSLVKS